MCQSTSTQRTHISSQKVFCALNFTVCWREPPLGKASYAYANLFALVATSVARWVGNERSEMRATPKTLLHALNLYIIWDACALQACPIHNSHYRIIFFQGSFFYVYIESPNSTKSQKTPHHSLETPSTEKTNPKNQIQDPNMPTPEPP